MIHFGPVYYDETGARRLLGKSLALCAQPVPTPGQSITLSTHKPWITCLACLARLDIAGSISPGATTEDVHGGPEGPGCGPAGALNL